jgi:acyl transferase domain-containing protein/surfactin synthase thioesterase subunit
MLEPVAIVGMACRVPGARGLAEFWRMLAAGEDAIRETPVERWDQEALFSEAALTPGKMNTRWGGFIDGVERFDPHFFGISPREAEHMDPQQRLLLEVVWEAIEDAGLSREAIAGSPSGVFIGMSSSDFAREELADLSGLGTHSTTGAAQSIAANRISYALDLNGPSMVVDTACSSSLVAIHLACHSLQLDEAGMAIAGGVNLLLSPGITVGFSQLNAMASDGRCKAFDARANGYVRSEGVGIVVLKRLKDALEAGDRIWAVIRGSAVNQDGRSNGLTAPSRSAQEAVLATAYRKAGVSPAMVQYVEAHGTGTKLGDPIEAGALGKVLGTGRATGDRCRLGSVKTNIGHLEGAAGVAGVIKVALAMHHRLLPPSLHFESPNPHIAFDRLPLQVQTALDAWPHPDRALLAGVSSFGFGGTNAHLVLEQAPEAASATSASERGAYLLPLSAHSREALGALARSFQPMLEAMAPPLPDLVYAASRRTHHDCRLALAFRTPEELRSLLSGLETADSPGDEPKFARPRVAFVLPGQGAQWYAMGRQLLESNVAFRQAIEAIDERFQPMAGWSLLEEWQKDEAHSRMQETEVAQPSLFALQVGLAAVWRSWGIRPDAVVGHSIGEVAAAYLAGVLDLDEALLVALSRSRLMQEATGKGKMAAVALSPEEAHVLLEGYEGRVALAAVNAPHSVTLSGDLDAMDELMATLQARQVFCRELKVRYAFHCHQLTPFQAKLKERLHEMSPKPPTCTLVSTLSGKPAVPGDYDADYWSRQMREPVAFYPAVHHLVERGFDLFVELSPHPVLSTSLDEILRADAKVAAVVPTLRRGEDESLAMMKALGELYVHGYPIDWTNVYPNGAHVSLPAYPWQHERFWIDDVDPRRTDHPSTDDPDGHAEAEQRGWFAREWLLADPQLRMPMLEAHLKQHVTRILRGHADSVRPDSLLATMGFDSLMSLDLRNRLEVSLGIDLEVNVLWKYPSLEALAPYLAERIDPLSMRQTSVPKRQSAVMVRPMPSESAGMRLFCFPYAGGGASVYSSWLERLPPDVELCLVQLPGRENRIEDPPFFDMESLIVALGDELKPLLDRPFAFFGHSLGALISFELASWLGSRNEPSPVHLFVSGYGDPRQPLAIPGMDLVETNDEASLISLLQDFKGTPPEVLGHRDLLRQVLPAVRADFAIASKYRFAPREPLTCDITAFGGDADDLVPVGQFSGWKDLTRGTFKLRIMPGDHFFLRSNRAQLIAMLVDSLRMALPSSSRPSAC